MGDGNSSLGFQSRGILAVDVMNKKFIFGYWIIAWIFTVIFGEVITGIISKNPTFFNILFLLLFIMV